MPERYISSLPQQQQEISNPHRSLEDGSGLMRFFLPLTSVDTRITSSQFALSSDESNAGASG